MDIRELVDEAGRLHAEINAAKQRYKAAVSSYEREYESIRTQIKEYAEQSGNDSISGNGFDISFSGHAVKRIDDVIAFAQFIESQGMNPEDFYQIDVQKVCRTFGEAVLRDQGLLRTENNPYYSIRISERG